MRTETVSGSDDSRVRGRKGTYVVVQINEDAYEVLLDEGRGYVRTVGYGRDDYDVNRVIREHDGRR